MKTPKFHFHGKINKKFCWELNFFYRYRDFDDGISFIEIEVGWDKYKADHKPSFRIWLAIMNWTIIEFEIYNIYLVEDA